MIMLLFGPDGKMTSIKEEEKFKPVWHRVISKKSVESSPEKPVNPFFVVQPKVTQQDFVSE
jgi:hypothetical protein